MTAARVAFNAKVKVEILRKIFNKKPSFMRNVESVSYRSCALALDREGKRRIRKGFRLSRVVFVIWFLPPPSLIFLQIS